MTLVIYIYTHTHILELTLYKDLQESQRFTNHKLKKFKVFWGVTPETSDNFNMTTFQQTLNFIIAAVKT